MASEGPDRSGDAGAELAAAAERLDRISAELEAPETEDSRAVVLAQEAAKIAAEVGNLAAEAARRVAEQDRD